MKFLRLSGNVYRDRKAKPARNRTRHSSTLFRVPLMTFAPQGQPQISLAQSEASPWVKCPPPYAIALKGHNMNHQDEGRVCYALSGLRILFCTVSQGDSSRLRRDVLPWDTL